MTSGFLGSGTLEFSKMTDKGRCYHLSVFNAQESDRFSAAEDILVLLITVNVTFTKEGLKRPVAASS